MKIFYNSEKKSKNIVFLIIVLFISLFQITALGNQTITNGISYDLNPNGYLDVKNNGNHIWDFGFGVTGTFGGIDRTYTTENFTWTGNNTNGLTLDNNNNQFRWIVNINNGKIKHDIQNKFTSDINGIKFWYYAIIPEETTARYNGTSFVPTIKNKTTIKIPQQEVIPQSYQLISIGENRIDFSDLIYNGFDITEVYYGNGSILNRPNDIIIALAVTNSEGKLSAQKSLSLDPILSTTSYKHAGISTGSFTNSKNANISDDTYATATAIGQEINQTNFNFLTDEGGNITNGSYIQGIDIQIEAKHDCFRDDIVLNLSLSGNNGTTYKTTLQLTITSTEGYIYSSEYDYPEKSDTGGNNVKWTTDELRNGNFTIKIIPHLFCTGGSLYIDDIKVNIGWTAPSITNVTNTNLDVYNVQGNLIYYLANSDLTSTINSNNIISYVAFDWDDTQGSTQFSSDYHPSSEEFYQNTLQNPIINSTCGLYGLGGCFNGTQYLYELEHSRLRLENFTISAWTYDKSSASGKSVVAFGNKLGSGIPITFAQDWTLRKRQGGKMEVGFTYANGTYMFCRNTITTNNVWIHYVGIKNSTTLSLYKNGVLDASCNIDPNGILLHTYPGAPPFLSIGSIRDVTLFTQFWLGNLDEIMVLDTALNSSDVLTMYNNQSKRFYPRGELVFPNQNIGANNTINISAQMVIPSGTSFNISIGNKSGSTYVYNPEIFYNSTQMSSIAVLNNISINTLDNTNFSIKFIFYPDSNQFISPVLNQTINVLGYNSSAVAGATNYVISATQSLNILFTPNKITNIKRDNINPILTTNINVKLSNFLRNTLQSFFEFLNINYLKTIPKNILQSFTITGSINKLSNFFKSITDNISLFLSNIRNFIGNRDTNNIINLNLNAERRGGLFRSSLFSLIINQQINKVYGRLKSITQEFMLSLSSSKIFGGNRNTNNQIILTSSINKLYNSMRTNTLSLIISNSIDKIYSGFRSITQLILFNLSQNRVYEQSKGILNSIFLFFNINKEKGQSSSIYQGLTISSLADKIQGRLYNIFNNLVLNLNISKLSNLFKSINQQFILTFSSIRKSSFNILISFQLILNNFIDYIYSAIGVDNTRDVTQSFFLTNIVNNIHSIFRDILQRLLLLFDINRKSNLNKNINQDITLNNLISRTYNSIRNNQLSIILSSSVNKIFSSFRSIFQEIVFNFSTSKAYNKSKSILNSIILFFNIDKQKGQDIEISQQITLISIIEKIQSRFRDVVNNLIINLNVLKSSSFFKNIIQSINLVFSTLRTASHNILIYIKIILNNIVDLVYTAIGTQNLRDVIQSFSISNLVDKIVGFNKNVINQIIMFFSDILKRSDSNRNVNQRFILNEAANRISNNIIKISNSFTITDLINKITDFRRSLQQIFNINSISQRTAGFIRSVINSLTYFLNLIASFISGVTPSVGGGGVSFISGGGKIEIFYMNLTQQENWYFGFKNVLLVDIFSENYSKVDIDFINSWIINDESVEFKIENIKKLDVGEYKITYLINNENKIKNNLLNLSVIAIKNKKQLNSTIIINIEKPSLWQRTKYLFNNLQQNFVNEFINNSSEFVENNGKRKSIVFIILYLLIIVALPIIILLILLFYRRKRKINK